MKAPSVSLLRALQQSCRPVVPTKCLSTRTMQQCDPSRFTRSFHVSFRSPLASPPKSNDRGPISKEETQTDFSALDVLGGTPPPATSIDACLSDGFHLGNSVQITEGDGCLLIAGEAFRWRPWQITPRGRLLNDRGQWDVQKGAWGLLDLVWPKPDMLVIGLGPTMRPLSPATRAYISSLGISVEVQDTRNAAAQFNLLATERGVGSIAAALIPFGHKEP